MKKSFFFYCIMSFLLFSCEDSNQSSKNNDENCTILLEPDKEYGGTVRFHVELDNEEYTEIGTGVAEASGSATSVRLMCGHRDTQFAFTFGDPFESSNYLTKSSFLTEVVDKCGNLYYVDTWTGSTEYLHKLDYIKIEVFENFTLGGEIRINHKTGGKASICQPEEYRISIQFSNIPIY